MRARLEDILPWSVHDSFPNYKIILHFFVYICSYWVVLSWLEQLLGRYLRWIECLLPPKVHFGEGTTPLWES